MRLRWYPDLRIIVGARAFPFPCGNSDIERLPAYSGATVPEFHRLPARKRALSYYRSAGAASW